MSSIRLITSSLFTFALLAVHVSAHATPSIELLSPNGGETWHIGESHTISWSASPDVKRVMIHVSRGIHDVGTIAITGNSGYGGSFEWTIPKDFLSAFGPDAGRNSITLMVQVPEHPDVFDTSDTPFSILNEDEFMRAFPDVPASNPNAAAIAYVQAEGIVEGYSDGTFRPDQTINRAEFTKIVMGAKQSLDIAHNGVPAPVSTELQDGITIQAAPCFLDIPSHNWYVPYVCAAKNQGIIGGYPDGTFRPDTAINFVEAAKILVETFKLPASQTSIWYEGYVRALEERNGIPSSIRSFDQHITRGEMAEMIYRLNGDQGLGNRDQINLDATYTNEKLGIAFQYPSDWVIREQTTQYTNRIYIENQEYKGYNIFNYPDDFLSVFIEYRKPSSATISYESSIQKLDGMNAEKDLLNSHSIPIHVYEFSYDPNSERSGVGPYLHAVWQTNSWIFNAYTMDSDSRVNNQAEVSLLKQILSTIANF